MKKTLWQVSKFNMCSHSSDFWRQNWALLSHTLENRRQSAVSALSKGICCREGLSTETLEQPEWSGLREPSFGMGTFTVENTTHAVWHWHRNKDNVTEVRGLTSQFYSQHLKSCVQYDAKGRHFNLRPPVSTRLCVSAAGSR